MIDSYFTSSRGIGAVLSQTFDEEGDRPVAYYSKKLSSTQSRYTATEKECLAAFKAINHFAVYLLGRHFTLVTYHKPLQRLPTMDNSNQRLMRWSLSLQQYDFYVVYRPGRENCNADGLSRQDFTATLSEEEGGGGMSGASPWMELEPGCPDMESGPELKSQ